MRSDVQPVANATIAHAIEFASRADATVRVAYAVEPRVLVEGADDETPANAAVGQRIYTEDIEVAEARGEDVLADAEERVAAAGLSVEAELLYGDPVDSVAEYAAAEDVDGIVVGHRGLSSQVERMVGSVAKGLVEHATVPVTVVK